VGPAWTSATRTTATRAEYWAAGEALADGRGLQAPNRSQQIRTRFGSEGIRIEPREEGATPWELHMALVRVGTPGRTIPVAPAPPRAVENRIEYRRAGLTEWYVNDGRGLEQGFTLEQPLDGARSAGVAHLELALSGSVSPRLRGQSLVLEQGGSAVLSYAGLRSWDARGRDLPSRMELEAHGEEGSVLRLVVDVANAEYPVTIDPLVTTPAWQQDGGQADARFGGFVATADVNGDGFADAIVGAPYFDTGAVDAGRVFVYHGSASGPSAVADWTADGGAAGALFGVVASAGDVNGDGYDDLIVGAPGVTNGEVGEGAAFVYLGGPSGLSTTPDWSAEGNQATAAFGTAVAGAGDVNGDGYADVIVGAPNFDNVETNEGRVFVYYGSASGPGSTPWTAESNQNSALFGSAVTGGGDFNADGFADIAVGAPYWDQGGSNNGRVFVYHGAASGLPAAPTRTLDQPTFRNEAHYGQALAVVGDVDGDRYSDLVVGEPNWLNAAIQYVGQASLYRGGAAGLGATPAWTATGTSGSEFGGAIAAAGDLDDDGYGDWIVGSPGYSAGLGRVYLYHGAPTSSLGTLTSSALPSTPAPGRFGGALAAGDVDGDGFSDVLVGADAFDGAFVDEGRALLFLGQPDAALLTPAMWMYQSNVYGAEFGQKTVYAGDVNGDGYPDIVVGTFNSNYVYGFYGTSTGLPSTRSWLYGSSGSSYSIGRAVAAAGDVNGDGYSDVVFGEWGWSNGQTFEGRALLFLGSPTGLGATPDWTYEPDVVETRLGISVAGAGDVNGDGYADVIVGAAGDDFSFADGGRAFVFLGSPSGRSPTPSWFVIGQQAGEGLGGAVAGLGDVNGDGFADVAVGSYGWDNGETDEGRVQVYLGSASGLSIIPAWAQEGNQDSAHFASVTTAGDVNGDGFADMAVVAPDYDGGSTDEGRLYVYHGSGSGLATTPAFTWEPNTCCQDMIANAAGDVNGDGYGDVAVGRPGATVGLYSDNGVAQVFFGSPTGLTGAVTPTVSQSATYGARFGESVGTAGDVDGDGRAEVIVGAKWWQNSYPAEASEGAAFVYNLAAGRPGRSQTLRGGGQAELVPHEGRARDPDDFQVRLTSVSPYGRVRVKVEVEACPPGAAWGSAACTVATSPAWLDLNSTAGVVDTITVPGLASRTFYRWRARTLYAPYSVTEPGITPPPKPRHTPWRRMQGQALSGDVRTDQGITVRMAVAAANISETNLQVTFGVTMETADGQPNLYPVTVQFDTMDGTATAGQDYTATSSTITWPAGFGNVVTEYRNIALAGGDGLSEGPENFAIQLSSPDNAALAAPTSEVVTIIDSDPRLVSIADTSVVEGNSGTTTATFAVTLSYADAGPVSVNWTTAPGSASPGSDYVTNGGVVSFAAFETLKYVQVTVNGDTLDEGDESFQVDLSSPVGAGPGDMSAIGTIQNDDAPGGDDVTVFVATATNAHVELEWVYPATYDTVRIRYDEGASCTAPTDPDTGGTLLGEFTGTMGEAGSAPHSTVVNGTQYCYRIWTVTGGSTIAGAETHARPFDNSAGQPAEPIAWAYTTGASTVAAPGIGVDTVLVVSNDYLVHGMGRGFGAGSGLWPAGFRPRWLPGPVQERPAVVGLPVIPGATSFTLLGSQDGSVYAVDAVGGGIKWTQPLLPASEVRGAPAAFFSAWGAPWGITFDLTLAATHTGAAGNRIYALDVASGVVVGTPYDDGGAMGSISSMMSLDYPTKRAYVTSRTATSSNSLWCFDVSASGLSLAWAKPAGEIDASPILRAGVVYTSTIDGDIMAYSAATGDPVWSGGSTPFPTEVGGVKSFIFPDRLSPRLYLSTTTKVWALSDTGTEAVEDWSTTVVPSPSTPVFVRLGGLGYVFVGGGDGRLYQLDEATGTVVKWVQLGGPSDVMGAPTFDLTHSLVYIGGTAGIIYAVRTPLP